MAPRKLYLDTATWAHLHAATDTRWVAVEQRLRARGADGSIALLVSGAHLLELPPSAADADARLDFMRSFPATFFVHASPAAILKHDAANLARAAVGEPRLVLSIDTTPLATADRSMFERFRPALRATSLLTRGMAAAERASRWTRVGVSRDEQTRRRNATLAMLAGDTAEFFRLRGEAPRERLAGLCQRATLAIGSALGSVIRRTGLAGEIEHADDPVFNQVVVSRLPADVRSSASAMREVRAIYNDRKRFVAVAPAMACVAAVVRRTEEDPRAAYEGSEEIDGMHAAYAPLVDVFTADKRTCHAIRTYAGTVLRSTALVLASDARAVLEGLG